MPASAGSQRFSTRAMAHWEASRRRCCWGSRAEAPWGRVMSAVPARECCRRVEHLGRDAWGAAGAIFAPGDTVGRVPVPVARSRRRKRCGTHGQYGAGRGRRDRLRKRAGADMQHPVPVTSKLTKTKRPSDFFMSFSGARTKFHSDCTGETVGKPRASPALSRKNHGKLRRGCGLGGLEGDIRGGVVMVSGEWCFCKTTPPLTNHHSPN